MEKNIDAQTASAFFVVNKSPIPKVMHYSILSFIDLRDLRNVALTCKKNYFLMKNEQGRKLFFPFHAPQNIQAYDPLFNLAKFLSDGKKLKDISKMSYEDLKTLHDHFNKAFQPKLRDHASFALFQYFQAQEKYKGQHSNSNKFIDISHNANFYVKVYTQTLDATLGDLFWQNVCLEAEDKKGIFKDFLNIKKFKETKIKNNIVINKPTIFLPLYVEMHALNALIQEKFPNNDLVSERAVEIRNLMEKKIDDTRNNPFLGLLCRGVLNAIEYKNDGLNLAWMNSRHRLCEEKFYRFYFGFTPGTAWEFLKKHKKHPIVLFTDFCFQHKLNTASPMDENLRQFYGIVFGYYEQK